MAPMMSRKLTRRLPLMAAAAGLLLTATARAHFTLLKPAPWINEDSSGGPQKGGPCGPGGFDDVQPMPLSMDITTVHAGDTIMVELEETVHHPGWFRIALAEDRSTFKDPTFPNTNNCTVDLKTVPTTPHDNVLADGLEMDSSISGPKRKITEMVKIPDKPCDKCTLQVIQVMADALHAPPGCIYYHCADLKILPAGASTAGSGAAGAAGSSSAAGTGGAVAGGPGGGDGAAAAGGSSAGSAAAAGGSVAGSSGSGAGVAGSGGAAMPNANGGSAGTAAAASGSTTAPASSSGCSTGSFGASRDNSVLSIALIGLGLTVARVRRKARS